MTPNPDAVKAAAVALREYGWTCEYHEPATFLGECSQCDDSHNRSAALVLAAAEPVLRRQIAAEIRAEAARLDALTITHQNRTAATVLQIKREATIDAARIAEGAHDDGEPIRVGGLTPSEAYHEAQVAADEPEDES